MPDIDLIPKGELEGSPAVRLVVPEQVDHTYLLRQYTSIWRTGTNVLWIDDASWGSTRFDDCVSYLMSDPRMADLVVWSERGGGEEEWSPSPMWNCVNMSSLFKIPQTSKLLVNTMVQMPFIPQPAELVVENPLLQNLLPSLLDEVSTRLDPQVGGWIYVDGKDEKLCATAVSACSSASTRWGVRYAR